MAYQERRFLTIRAVFVAAEWYKTAIGASYLYILYIATTHLIYTT